MYWKSLPRVLKTVHYPVKLNIEIAHCALYCHKRKNEPQHHMGCLDTFGRPRGESPEKKQSVAQWRSLLGVPLCVNNSHNQRVWQLQSSLEIIPNHSIYRSEKKDQSWHELPVSVHEQPNGMVYVEGLPGALPRAVGLHPSCHCCHPAWECGGHYEIVEM